ncbi:MAG: potassium channel family protein [Verrucomicrobiota bacterium]
MTALQFVGPILGILALWIALTGLVVGRLEKWSKLDSVYYAFITATTVGYGDFRPKHRLSKIAAIILALAGLVFTGILVAAALKAIDYTLVEYNGLNLETLPEENLLLKGK